MNPSASTMNSSPPKAMPTAKMGLAGLPAELRLIVYRNLFVIGIANLYAQGHLGTGEIKSIQPGRKTIRATAQLLRTCKLFYDEGLPVLYGENTFYFYDGIVLNGFLMDGGHIAASYMRSIVLRNAAGMAGKRAPNLFLLPNLRKFYFMGSVDEWDRDAVDNCLPRRLWGSLSLRTEPDQIDGIERNVPAVRFLQRLLKAYPAIKCGVFSSTELRTQTGLPSNKFALFHYKIVPRGRKNGRRTFAIEYDPDFPTEDFATTFFEGARPHTEMEMSFTNRNCVEDNTGDDPATTVQAAGKAEVLIKLETSVDDQIILKAAAADENTLNLQTHGKAGFPIKLATVVEEEVSLETGSGKAALAPEK
ncbi:Mannan endo-1-6-alpha-mannosidase [Venturia nashicola]|uniref:Mannan endo-1-6-alpha-mannosidase n=1 Tax=Venturia nashicola TaxID=86259 RepID=A0A4Z1NSH3_9PEZI|nr:Mannan endo-1-6-alpha-mannosidase [Venturia nashicola]TLD29708.1 Mannan endo-1-6-alpha-mannosidase [Venturia nashicola]